MLDLRFHGGEDSSSSGLWCCVVLYYDTNNSEVHAASHLQGEVTGNGKNRHRYRPVVQVGGR